MSEPTKATCSRCKQSVFLQTGTSGKKYYTNSTDRQDFHSKTCSQSSTDTPPTANDLLTQQLIDETTKAIKRVMKTG